MNCQSAKGCVKFTVNNSCIAKALKYRLKQKAFYLETIDLVITFNFK